VPAFYVRLLPSSSLTSSGHRDWHLFLGCSGDLAADFERPSRALQIVVGPSETIPVGDAETGGNDG
jgi:hypothetical protein